MSTSREFIRALDIGPDPLSSSLQFMPTSGGAVVAGSIVAIKPGITELHWQAVSQSLLLAQLVANAKADRHKDAVTWYREYQALLDQIGWVVHTSTTMTRYLAPGTRFTVPMVITDLFKHRTLSEELALIGRTLNAFKRDAAVPAQLIFECPSHAGGIGNFQVGLVAEEAGAVSLRLGRCYFSSPAHVTRLMFEEFSPDARFQIGWTVMTLNEQVYSVLRESIARKLESRLAGSVALFPLPTL